MTATVESLTREQSESFDRDGFLIVEEGLISDRALEPDEVNWVPGRDPEDRTRQICNGWKADETIAAMVLHERIGRLGGQLSGWSGTRILQDNVLWKPPGTKAIGFHQDASYAGYLVPPVMLTCWLSLHDTTADAGPVAYVPGSHRWPVSPRKLLEACQV